jgi:two-component system sensor histidine kinase KdpD
MMVRRGPRTARLSGTRSRERAQGRHAGWRGHASLTDILGIVVAVVLATAGIALLEGPIEVANASALYLVAVVVAAIAGGTIAGVVVAIVCVLTYDLLFTAPALTLAVTDPNEVLELLILSFVGITVGRLVALQRQRAAEAEAREREAQDLFAISESLAARSSMSAALVRVVDVLARSTGFARVWIGIGQTIEREHVLADSGSGPLPAGGTMASLRRSADEPPGEWRLIHPAAAGRAGEPGDLLRYRVAIESGGATIGSIWGSRPRSAPAPDPRATRLLVAAADQVGQAVEVDRSSERAAQARVAQEGDALKSALVESVSHDLRIPLAAIRAATGPLIAQQGDIDADEVRATAVSIDHEASRLDRLVSDLLDLGRVQSGMLKAHLEAVELREVVVRVVEQVGRIASSSDPGPAIDVHMEETWVDADPVLLQQVIANILENAWRHLAPGTAVVIRVDPATGDGQIRLWIEDAGPGVSDEALDRLFDRFYRLRVMGSSRRPGSGLGLAVARGFVEAMGGSISASHSQLGGLAVELVLPATVIPAGLLTEA